MWFSWYETSLCTHGGPVNDHNRPFTIYLALQHRGHAGKALQLLLKSNLRCSSLGSSSLWACCGFAPGKVNRSSILISSGMRHLILELTSVAGLGEKMQLSEAQSRCSKPPMAYGSFFYLVPPIQVYNLLVIFDGYLHPV